MSRQRMSLWIVSAACGTLVSAMLAVPPASASDHTDYATSFEDSDPLPDWEDSVEDDRSGGLSDPMSSARDTGPRESPTANTEAGYTGTHSAMISGQHSADARGHSYNKILDTDVTVTGTSQLSYMVYPVFVEDELDNPSTYAAVDLAFTDGTYLSELDAVDHHGVGADPTSQGESETLYTDQWNHKVIDLGAVAAGKTVDRVLLGYDKPEGSGQFTDFFDDIEIAGEPELPEVDSPADHVLTTRGTQSSGDFSRGNNFPATGVPHGFNFYTPVTDAGSTSWLYEYHRANNADNRPELQALSVSHETSPWMGDRQTFQVMPSTASGTPEADPEERALSFGHDNEIAQAHHYGVTFDNGLRTDIAPSDHSSVFRFSFPDDNANLVFDNVDDNAGLTLDVDSGTVSGYSDVASGLSTGATRMFVYAEFDQPVTGGEKLPDGGGGENTAGYLSFDAGDGRTVEMRLATSLLSVEQAQRNLDTEVAGKSFSEVRDEARALWDEKLSVIEVEGATADQLTTLYSNLYRLFLYPNIGHENVGTVKDPKYRYASPFQDPAGQDTPTETGATIVDGEVFVNNGFWDTYRTTWPAYSLFASDSASEMVDGFVQQYRDGGWISRWSSPGYADLMTGTSSDVAFADAYAKGIDDFDVESAYDAALKNATVAPPDDSVGRKGLETSIFDGYTSTETHEGMSWALEGYINDFGIANMSRQLYEADPDGERAAEYQTNYEYFGNRALNYVHMFDPEVDFFQGRDADGDWRVPPEEFNPAEWGHDYTETNAWNMAFTVPHDAQGLANLYGGEEEMASKLDEFFTTPETAEFPGSYDDVIHEMLEARDTRMGMYGHSNQPSHHIPWMYDYVGQPWKTQELTREVTSRLYLGGEIGKGYPGDEDNGEMSAWWLFSALGFYPQQMGSDTYTIGSPLFTKATVHLDNGADIVVNAPDNNAENVYVQDLRINGTDHDETYLGHDTLSQGATLDFDMGPEPSDWGTGPDAAPPSLTEGDEVADPDADLTAGADCDVTELFDDTSETAASGTGLTTACELSDAAEAGMYTLTSDDADAAPSRWRLEGSTDGEEWTTVDERDGESFRWDTQTRAFTVPDAGEYSQYRLIVTDSGSTDLSEVEFLG